MSDTSSEESDNNRINEEIDEEFLILADFFHLDEAVAREISRILLELVESAPPGLDMDVNGPMMEAVREAFQRLEGERFEQPEPEPEPAPMPGPVLQIFSCSYLVFFIIGLTLLINFIYSRFYCVPRTPNCYLTGLVMYCDSWILFLIVCFLSCT